MPLRSRALRWFSLALRLAGSGPGLGQDSMFWADPQALARCLLSTTRRAACHVSAGRTPLPPTRAASLALLSIPLTFLRSHPESDARQNQKSEFRLARIAPT